jgi:NitT/TauT family transport system substrate-binding protein
MLGKMTLLAIGVQVSLAVACASPATAPPAARPAAPPASSGAAPAAAPPTAPSGAPAAVAPPPRQAMKYGYVPILAGGAMFIAQDRGYFAEQGIDLEMVSFDSGALLTPAVAAGQLEAGHGTPGPALFNVLAREITMKAVSVISWNGTVVMVRKDLADAGQIQTVQDLKGKRVSLMVEGSPIDFTMRRVLYQNGLSLGDLDVQRLSMPDSVPALANNAVDAVTVVEPFPVLIESRGLGVRALGVQDLVWKDAASVVLLGPSMLNRGDAANVAFMTGFVKGLRDLQAALQDNKVVEPEVLDIVSRWTKIAPDVVARAGISGAPPNGRIDLDDLSRQQDFWFQEGDVRTKADLGSFVEYRYLDAAVAQLP